MQGLLQPSGDNFRSYWGGRRRKSVSTAETSMREGLSINPNTCSSFTD